MPLPPRTRVRLAGMLLPLACLTLDPAVRADDESGNVTVISARVTPSYVRTRLSDGTYAPDWGIFAGGTVEPASIDAVKAGRTQMRRLAGAYPASVNEDNWPRLFKRLSAECGFTADQVDQLIFTQISKPSIAIAAQRCKVPMEKCHTIMEKWGYTGTACIPMTLDDAIELGKVKRGDLVVMISSGLGWNQVAAAVRMTA